MAFKLTNPPFPKSKRKQAKDSAKQSVEGAAKLGVQLDEKKLFKQELHDLKRMKALAKGKHKKFEKHTKKMFNA